MFKRGYCYDNTSSYRCQSKFTFKITNVHNQLFSMVQAVKFYTHHSIT